MNGKIQRLPLCFFNIYSEKLIYFFFFNLMKFVLVFIHIHLTQRRICSLEFYMSTLVQDFSMSTGCILLPLTTNMPNPWTLWSQLLSLHLYQIDTGNWGLLRITPMEWEETELQRVEGMAVIQQGSHTAGHWQNKTLGETCQLEVPLWALLSLSSHIFLAKQRHWHNISPRSNPWATWSCLCAWQLHHTSARGRGVGPVSLKVGEGPSEHAGLRPHCCWGTHPSSSSLVEIGDLLPPLYISNPMGNEWFSA